MTRTDFYILGDSDSVPDFTCRLVEKVYNLGETVAVWLADRGEAEALDRRLWTFRQESFIPHAIADNPAEDREEPVRLCPNQPAAASVLINLTGRMVPDPAAFSRIAEVVSGDESARQEARARYRAYRDAGCELKVHTMDQPV